MLKLLFTTSLRQNCDSYKYIMADIEGDICLLFVKTTEFGAINIVNGISITNIGMECQHIYGLEKSNFESPDGVRGFSLFQNI